MSVIPPEICRALISAVVRQALTDHAKCLRKARRELTDMRMKSRLPAPVDVEVLGYAMMQEPARWIMSDDITPWSFLWCCDHVELNPKSIRREMNRASFTLRVNEAERRAA